LLGFQGETFRTGIFVGAIFVEPLGERGGCPVLEKAFFSEGVIPVPNFVPVTNPDGIALVSMALEP